MSQNIATLSLPITASGAVTAHRAVGFDGAQAGTQGQKIMGIARSTVADGEKVTLDVAGTVVMESGGVIAVGDSIIVDAQGRAIKSTGSLAVASGATAVTSSAANGNILTGGDAPEFVLGDALEAASAAGQFIEVLLRR